MSVVIRGGEEGEIVNKKVVLAIHAKMRETEE